MSFEALMNQLKIEYVQELPQKIQLIQKDLSQKSHENIKESFHKLKGTGTTYGIPEISELAEILEKICIEKPHLIEEVVPTALILLQEIHGSRTAAQVFDIASDQRFSHIKRHAS